MLELDAVYRSNRRGAARRRVLALEASTFVTASIIAAGIGLRLWQYLANASLGVDEAALARNIVDRSAGHLLTRLDFGQVAPPAFLLAEKAIVALMGDSEYALRLIPLACGLASIFLFAALAKRILNNAGRVLALAMFSLGIPFIYYSSEVKQYSGDVAATLLVLLFAIESIRGAPSRRRILAYALTGAVLPWFSQASVFAIIGVSAVIAARALGNRGPRAVLACIALWLGSSALALLFAAKNLSPDDWAFLRRFWEGGFVPLTLRDGAALRWAWTTLQGVFSSFSNAPPTLDGGMHYPRPWLFAALAVAGGVTLTAERRAAALIVCAPITIVLAASAAGRYPFAGRVALFVVPLFLILAAAGAESLAAAVRAAVGPGAIRRVAILVFVALAAFPLRALTANLPPDRQEDLRPVIQYVAAHRQAGDAVHVYYGAGQGFRFYAGRTGFDASDYDVGRCATDQPRAYLDEIDRLRGRPRVWVVFSHSLQGAREIRLIVEYLDAIGRRLDAAPPTMAPLSAHAYAFLYDLSARSVATSGTFPIPGDWNARSRDWLCYGPMTP